MTAKVYDIHINAADNGYIVNYTLHGVDANGSDVYESHQLVYANKSDLQIKLTQLINDNL